MAFFKKKNKKRKIVKYGTSSNISQLRSPYRGKTVSFKKNKKKITQSINPKGRLQKTKRTPSGKGKTILAAILSIGILSYGTYALFFSDYFLIENFTIEEKGTIIDDYEKMGNILQKLLGKNIILIDEGELKKKIIEEHPEIEKIHVDKIFPDTIAIKYEKYPVAANIINIVEGIQKKFIVDSHGFLIEENIEHPDLPHIYYETTEFLHVRTNFLIDAKRSQERLIQIVNTTNLFEEKFGIKILYAEFKKKEREVHLHTEKYFYILIDLEKNINRQIEKLKKALSKLDIYTEPLVYIDLRISGTETEKVIFKRK